VLTLSLRQRGYDVLEANTGGSGLALTSSANPDLVLLDLSLPDLSGLEIAMKIKENPETAKIPLVALSGCSERELAVKTLGSGMAAYLTKPAATQELVNVIENLT
jgi:DNA-binding response OmpR family regulator